MIHLTPADYRHQPWANGRGTTTELYRQDRDGALLFRLSMAAVTEVGAFSIFPGIERNLTVLSGPGFTLEGNGLYMVAKPLSPIAFPGDLPVQAKGVTAASDDFNVMTARYLPRPEVRVIHGHETLAAGGLLALFALEAARVNDRQVGRHHLILTENGASIAGPVMAVRVVA
jgi:uncharacterized protein